MQRKIRLKDVAEKAGVAVNTASTILNRRPNSWASKATEERVFSAAKELGYRPSKTARALQSGRYDAIGFLVQDLSNPFYTTLADEMESAVEEKGFKLVIENCRSSAIRERRIFEGLSDLEVDGAALWLSDHAPYLEDLSQRPPDSLPLVALGNGIPTRQLPIDAVISDFRKGLGQAIEALHGLGHRRFTFLSAIADSTDDGSRNQLVKDLLIAADIPRENVEVLNCGPSIESAYETFRKCLASPTANRPTALIGLNDISALGAMRASIDAGLAIPHDLSIVGVDDIPFAGYSPISLSTVRQRYRKMTRMAAELILTRLAREDSQPEIPPRQIIFPTHFIARESIGPVASK